ncbi:uncharacterized protein [Rutidosis leptorrhynchoides]|uniref:uncharacterized protein n=1 Tax=Rutidosis leptorrhynchoides TaxID=125765 RepID=UPI003A98CE73
MSFLVYCLIFHLCVSMRPCNARQLGVFNKEPGKEFASSSEAHAQTIVEFEEEIINGDNMELKNSTIDFPLNKLNALAETDIKVQISQEKSKIEGWKNHARSAMESKQQDSKEAINKSKDNSFTEDVVVMDYAQPHRKPPIHNLDPQETTILNSPLYEYQRGP